jgi:hypothetical protein
MALSVGIDLSTRSCGMAVVRDDSLVASWQIKGLNSVDKWQRLRYVGEVIRSRFPRGVDVVVFENVRLFHGGRISIEAIRDLARLARCGVVHSVGCWGEGRRGVCTALAACRAG